MRGSYLLACTSVALAAAVACAASGDNDPPPDPKPDSGLPVPPDTGTVDAGPDVTPIIPSCSEAGWCLTALPDTDLMFKDIWPLEGRAFAITESPTLGIRVLEWDPAGQWKYIDDNSQNESGLGRYAGRIWAPNENEVYYGVGPGVIEHGTRPVAPATAWTWVRHKLVDHSPDVNPEHEHGYPFNGGIDTGLAALGVWGIGGDVYAWYANAIFRWKSEDGGPPNWVVEYIVDDVDSPDEHVFFLSASGTSKDDIWFGGNRLDGSACAFIVRKTPSGYKRLSDGITADRCPPRGDVIEVGGNKGWFTDLQALPGNRFTGLKGSGTVVMFAPENDTYALSYADVPPSLSGRGLYSLYAATEDQPWLTGFGLVVHGKDVWDGGAYGLSTISLNGGPISRPLYQVRGTSNTNLWAVGVRHALHKTTP